MARQMEWAADSISVISFSAPSASDTLQAWTRLFGVSPNSFQQNPVGTPPGSQASGQIGEYQFALNVQPGRKELMVNPAQSQTDGIPEIEDVKAALAALLPFGNRMIGEDQPTRLALVLNLSKAVTDSEAARKEFQNLTGVTTVPQGAMDLNFSINVRKPSSFGQELNRLCRWGSGSKQLFLMQMGPGGLAPNNFVVKEYPIISLQLDLNTVPTGSIIGSEAAQSILIELSKEADQLMAGGYDYLSH